MTPIFGNPSVRRSACERSARLTGGARCVALLGMLFGCKGSGGDAATDVTPMPAAEPERFSFSVPSGYVPLELRGEGSETLKAPPGARIHPVAGGFSIDAGPDFALDVRAQPPPLTQLASHIGAMERVLEEGDLVIFKSPAGYAFVVIRELVPEWDESERQRFACISRGVDVGSGSTRAEAPRFSRAAVQNMVAACRSLDLPKLE
jgi:hypothetical protein